MKKKIINRKIIEILVCMLLITPIFSMSVTADPSPKFNINIRGGAGVNVEVTNSGDEPAYNYVVECSVKGGLFDRIDKVFSKGGDVLTQYGLHLQRALVAGIGIVSITTTVSAENAAPFTVTAVGIAFGPFICVIRQR